MSKYDADFAILTLLMPKTKLILGGSQALLAAAFLFALTNVLVREMSTMWGDQAQVAVRFALVWMLLVIFTRFKKTARTTIPRSQKANAIIYSIVAATAILFFTLSVQATTIANTLFTSNATELFVAFLLGSLLLHEKVSARKLVAIALAVIGLFLYSGSFIVGSAGIIFGLLAGGTTALCNLYAKRLKGVDLGAIMRMQFGLGAVFMIGLTVLFSPDDIIRTVSFQGIAATILFALILIAATRLVLYGFQHSDINIATVMLSTQLAFGALLGFFIYQELLAPNEIVSGILILCAAIVGGVTKKPKISTT
jgi:drug/metabolite transporter (DMT)-like permease